MSLSPALSEDRGASDLDLPEPLSLVLKMRVSLFGLSISWGLPEGRALVLVLAQSQHLDRAGHSEGPEQTSDGRTNGWG